METYTEEAGQPSGSASARVSFWRHWAAPIVAALLGAAYIQTVTAFHGPGVTSDSVQYLGFADNLSRGSLVGISGEPFHWPPLYPALLALPSLFAIDPLAAVAPLQTVILAMILFVAVRWLAEALASSALFLAGSLALLLGLPVLRVAKFAWTEALFILMVLMVARALANYLRRPDGKRAVLVGFWVSLAWLTRYAGLAVAGWAGMFLLLTPGRPWRQRWRHLVLFAAFALAPNLIWAQLDGNGGGDYYGSGWSWWVTRDPNLPDPAGAFSWVQDAMASWFLPPWSAYAASVVLLWGWIGLGLIAWVQAGKDQNGRAGSAPLSRHSLWLHGAFSVIYPLFIALVISLVWVEQDPGRIMAPVFIPLMVWGLTALDRVTGRLAVRGGWMRRLPAWAALLVGLWCLAHPLRLGWVQFDRDRVGGIGAEARIAFSRATWRQDQVIAYLRDRPRPACIVSNAPNAIYLFLGMTAQLSVNRVGMAEDLERLRSKTAGCPELWLAWFNRQTHVQMAHPPTIGRMASMTLLTENPDGAVYRMRLPSGSTDAPPR